MAGDKSGVVPMKGCALLRRFGRVRALSTALMAGLSDADASVRSMPDASPAKWHLAHTTWFFENFILRDFVSGYREFDPRFSLLFNDAATGTRIPPASRGILTRPSLEVVRAYRAHVDAAMNRAILQASPEEEMLIELGCNYEEQHQERLMADILHLFAQNPLGPAVWSAPAMRDIAAAPPLRWIEGRSGKGEIGASGAGFSFDAERPRHAQWLEYHRLANRLVTNGEWLFFMEAGGYGDARLWPSDGWAWVRAKNIEAPLYWRRDEDGDWGQFGLGGFAALDIGAPVRNVSHYEADAFAQWAGGRLPTEPEWESAAEELDPSVGTFMDTAEAVEPKPAPDHAGLTQMFGDLWEWTSSAFLAYPRFQASPGAVGEYNGEFMTGQYVLKGGSCATPRGHVRASYRNSLHPHQRWQFTGVRLARDG